MGLQALRPDRIRVVTGSDGWPSAYVYTVGGAQPPLRPRRGGGLADPRAQPVPSGRRSWRPAADRGARPRHSTSTMRRRPEQGASRQCRPSLRCFGLRGGSLSEAQFDRLKGELEANYQGAGNAGRPLSSKAGWTGSLSRALAPATWISWRSQERGGPRDRPGLRGAAPAPRPTGDSTHANYAEANRALYRQTLIPLVRRTAQAIAHWLEPRLRRGSIWSPTSTGSRPWPLSGKSLWRRVQAADFLTRAEKARGGGLPARRTAA